MALALPQSLAHLEHKLKLVRAEPASEPRADSAPTGWAELDTLLSAGLPKGLVELQAQGGLGGGTSVSLAWVAAAQRISSQAWCAWVDPAHCLYAPGVALAGVALARLLVLRPRPSELLRTALRLVRASAFELVVIDAELGVEGAASLPPSSLENTARKLAMSAEEAGVSVVLLTHAGTRRRAPLPASLRLELQRTPHAIQVRVAKQRAGVGGTQRELPWSSKPYGLFT